jgi:hypothetical protein
LAHDRRFELMQLQTQVARVRVVLRIYMTRLKRLWSGIGAGFAKALVDSGAKVVLVDFNLAGAEQVAEELNAGEVLLWKLRLLLTSK